MLEQPPPARREQPTTYEGQGRARRMSVGGAGAAIGHLGRAARDTFPKRISKNPDGKSLPSSAHGASTGYDWLSGQAKLLPLSSRVGKHPVQHQYNRTAQSNLNTPPTLAALTSPLSLTLAPVDPRVAGWYLALHIQDRT
ncbi:hypothetical protein GX48_07240 [Paracoccidioides brasiliensis]|nr:hypothetical protein GX48_07240 [Paracoccidioides brasiliensis]